MMVLWRIGTDTPTYVADDRDGKGAEITGGRWNRPGTPVLYTATHISLAALETVVHLGLEGLPLNRYLVRFDVPAAVWNARITMTALNLMPGWDSRPVGKVSLDIGDAWLKSGSSSLMEVPSVVVPEEFNVLINPMHADARQIAVTKGRLWLYDARLRPQ